MVPFSRLDFINLLISTGTSQSFIEKIDKTSDKAKIMIRATTILWFFSVNFPIVFASISIQNNIGNFTFLPD